MQKVWQTVNRFKIIIRENQWVLGVLIFFVIFITLLLNQSRPSFLDPDSFYHLKISQLISQSGPVLNFPWLQFTVLQEYYIDHHFLYHVLALPFIFIFPALIGFKLYTVFLASVFFLFCYWFFKKEEVNFAEIFVLLLLFAPALLFRISLAKATALSLLLLFIGIYLIFQRRYWALAVISFFYVWTYGGFLLILAMCLLYILANALYQAYFQLHWWQKIKLRLWPHKFKQLSRLFISKLLLVEHLKLIGATVSGLVLGLIINPYFPKNISFYWQQVYEIGLKNYRGLVNVGGEWYPYNFFDLLADSGVAIITGAVLLVVFVILIKKQQPKSIFFFFGTILFFLLTLKSKRYVEYLLPFFVFWQAYSLKYILSRVDLRKFLKEIKKESYIIGSLTYFLLIYALFTFPFIMLKSGYLVYQQYQAGIEFARFSGISSYLQSHSQTGDIVMQTDWDDFPMLFYYNQQSYYIVGLDPTFMYKYDPELYQLFSDITTAKIKDKLSGLVKDNFQAKFFIVDADRQLLKQNLDNDNGFSLIYQDQDGWLYELKEK